jgi:hypothetical protein
MRGRVVILGPHAYDPDCYCLTCAYAAQEEMKETMSRSLNPKRIDISKVRDRTEIPGFVSLGHRHFEKANPAVKSSTSATINMPVDLLEKMCPSELTESIESIDIVYRKEA